MNGFGGVLDKPFKEWTYHDCVKADYLMQLTKGKSLELVCGDGKIMFLFKPLVN